MKAFLALFAGLYCLAIIVGLLARAHPGPHEYWVRGPDNESVVIYGYGDAIDLARAAANRYRCSYSVADLEEGDRIVFIAVPN
jgi:hypothetical protein